jgi:hypothetical protein
VKSSTKERSSDPALHRTAGVRSIDGAIKTASLSQVTCSLVSKVAPRP